MLSDTVPKHLTTAAAALALLFLTAQANAALALLFLAAQAIAAYRRRLRLKKTLQECKDSASAHHDLCEHSKIFEKKVIRVREDVLVATGYALANTICIRGETGLIIIDTCESVEAAAEALRDFRKVEGYSDLPVEGIIYTHFHSDHVGGTESYLKEAIPECQIWAHHTTKDRLLHFNLTMGPLAYTRGARQFGLELARPLHENSGIGPSLKSDIGSTILPNRSYGDEQSDSQAMVLGHKPVTKKSIDISGVKLDLIHAPGETDDQTVVFMPSHRILFAADNYYEAFPNLYAIRGVPHRDALQWVESLDTMRALDADVLVPSHTLPVYGREEIATRLRNYRDAISYVHNQTVRLALKGHHPDSIANKLRLPASLRGLEYTNEYYGTLAWSAKAIFSGLLGWFSGEASELLPLEPSERAKNLVALGGGPRKCLEVVDASIENGNVQWALELATALIDAPNAPLDVKCQATTLKIAALKALGEKQISANARNYYMTSALEASGELKLELPRDKKEREIMTAPIEDLLGVLPYYVDSDAAEGQSRLLRISFTDTNKSFALFLNNSVMTLASGPEVEEALLLSMGKGWAESARIVEVSCQETAWRKMMASPLSLGESWLSGNFKMAKGSLVDFKHFMACIDKRM